MTRHCLSGSRMRALSEFQTQIAAWSTNVNVRRRRVEWRMKLHDVRCKLKAVYPRMMLWRYIRTKLC